MAGGGTIAGRHYHPDPVLEEMGRHLPFHYTKIVADAGYESEENYHYLDGKEQLSCIKPANYEKAKTRKYHKDIGRAENMEYDAQTDSYICHNGKTLKAARVKTEKTKTGYQREVTDYSCGECEGCLYKKECIKATIAIHRHKKGTRPCMYLKNSPDTGKKVLQG